MSALAYNPETGDRSTAVSREVHITVMGRVYAFTIWCSRYTASKLTQDDWQAAGLKLRESVGTIRHNMALSGDLFTFDAADIFRKKLYDTLRHLVLERFRDRQFKAGNCEYQVDSLLAGEEYAI